MGPADLEKVLKGFPLPDDKRLITTWDCGEDAALWSIDENRIGILTLDFITPVVDSPKAWGRIAAANALSDVFAMGGRPFIALNIVAFPIKCLPLDTLREVMVGGQEKVSQAGAFLVGGHSVEDEEPKYGLCVFGEVEKTNLWKVTGANPGDVLIITKPVGSGIIATAIKADMVDEPQWEESATKWMETLNDLPLHMTETQRKSVSSCTDVTGFGLAGHMLDMLSLKDRDIKLDISSLPIMEGATELASMGLVPAGAYSNRELYEGEIVDLEKAEDLSDFLFDPQTSGGLLLTVAPEKAKELVKTAVEAGFTETAIIGHVVEGKGKIHIQNL